jgi:hypothetical protein
MVACREGRGKWLAGISAGGIPVMSSRTLDVMIVVAEIDCEQTTIVAIRSAEPAIALLT